jgi:UDPglucose 6-dehydrogenase
MRVCVAGLWHLGTVTAACLASFEHDVVGLDSDASVIDKLNRGEPPLFEPGLAELIAEQLRCGRLRFTADPSASVASAQVVWIAHDTPVDEEDRADVEFVVTRIKSLFPHLHAGTLVLISSQVPAGTTRQLEAAADPSISFAYSPENLRLGKAIQAFTAPDRIVVGTRGDRGRDLIEALFRPISAPIEWMSVESAEMTKHALNAFLATSVVFANELATICEQVGADAKEVERGLKSEARIGQRAYLSPGAAFAGGTLARDVAFLTDLGGRHHVPTHLLSAVRAGNDAHRKWTARKLQEVLGNVQHRNVALWGLTYKPGTNTLRRSSSVELCHWLGAQGARVQTHDPAIDRLPDELAPFARLCPTALDAATNADALIVATEWPDYLSVAAADLLPRMSSATVLDPGRFLSKTLGTNPQIRYYAVGKPHRHQA